MSINHLMPLYDSKPAAVINTSEPKVNYQQGRLSVPPLRFQTGPSLLARHPVQITTSSSAVGLLDTPSRKLSSLARRARLDRGRRAIADESRKLEPTPTPTTDDTAKPAPAASPSPEPARKRVPGVKQVTASTSTNPPTKLATTADDATKSTSKSSPTSPPSNSPATPPTKARVVDPNSPPATTPSPATSRTANITSDSLPAKSTPVPSSNTTSETSRGSAAIDNKPAAPATPAASKPPVETIPSPSPIIPSAPGTVTSTTPTETPKIGKAPESDSKGQTSHLTSIAIGVACAASLVIFVILVVIFKIRVSRKRARRHERFEEDFFGSHGRLSYSDSDASGRALIVPPRPIAGQSSSTPGSMTGAEKPITSGYPNLTGIGAHSTPTQSLADSARTYPPAPLNLQSSAYSPSPPRPPRSPLRPQATHKPGVYHRPPQGIGARQSYTPDSRSVYSSNSARGKAEMSEFYGQPTADYNYALEYLNNYYPTSHADSTYQASHAQGDMIGMDFMQVEDRPYDSRYTVDRNGILNNYAPSISGAVARDSDYYYKKRVP